jgi:murein DD-endopeptidase MepM/ murein hydrolase activator NlpD
VPAELTAQRKKTPPAPAKIEDLPRNAIDTLATDSPDTKVIIYSNNTWSYYRPSLGDRMDDLPVYVKNWDTSQVFSYPNVELSDLPNVVELKLISSLDEFNAPIRGKVFSKYGRRGRRNHNGVDIPLKVGEPIYATFSGKVRYSKYNSGGFGNLVIIRHENGLETWYGHLTRRNVESNEYVKAGQIIGFGGSTGRSRGPHLHFEMRYCDQTFDPEFLIDFETGQLRYQTFALEKSFFNINSRASDQLEEEDDFENYAFAPEEDGEEVSSEDIISRINNSQKQQKAKSTASVSQGNAVYHTIKSGDMLGKLAAKYGVSVSQICKLNNITATSILKLGKVLRIK